jgi:predicted PurR-regulated permease PerM
VKKLNEKYFTISVYALGVLAFTLLFLLIGLNLGSVFGFLGNTVASMGSLIYGILFAFIILPLVKRFDSLYCRVFCRSKERRMLVHTLSITTTYIIVLGLVFGTLLFVIPALIANVQELAVKILAVVSRVTEWVEAQTAANEMLAWVFSQIAEYLEGILSGLGRDASILVEKISGVLLSVLSQTADIFLGLIVSVYLIASRRIISGVCGKLVVAIFPEKFAVHFVVFFKRLYTDFCSFASTRIISSFAVSASLFVFAWLLKIPMFSVIVLLLLFLQIIPVIGTVIGVLGTSVIVFTLTGTLRAAVFLVILIALELLASNLLLPLFMPKKLRPNYGLATVLVIVGFGVGGVVGALLAVPVYATLNVEMRSFLAHRLAKKHMPISTEKYVESNLADLARQSEEAKAAEEAEKTADSSAAEEEAAGDSIPEGATIEQVKDNGAPEV